MREIPFFYHDLRARVVPGALWLAALGLFGVGAPPPYSAWFQGGEAWKTVVVPLLIALVIYVVGDVIEVSLRPIWGPLGCVAFGQSLRKQKGQLLNVSLNLESKKEETRYRHCLWQWLVITVSKAYPDAFVHAHRFQSEAKMFLNSSLPAAVFFGRLLCLHHHPVWAWPTGALVFVGCLTLSFTCEKRRWEQALATAEELLADQENFVMKADQRSKAVTQA